MVERADHIALANDGSRFHELEDYESACRCFERALKLAPSCPSVLYNLANSYFFASREQESLLTIEKLLCPNPEHGLIGCPHGVEDPGIYQLSALFVKFRALLFTGASWDEAFQCIETYTQQRSFGVESVYSDAEVEHWVNYYKQEFAGQR